MAKTPPWGDHDTAAAAPARRRAATAAAIRRDARGLDVLQRPNLRAPRGRSGVMGARVVIAATLASILPLSDGQAAGRAQQDRVKLATDRRGPIVHLLASYVTAGMWIRVAVLACMNLQEIPGNAQSRDLQAKRDVTADPDFPGSAAVGLASLVAYEPGGRRFESSQGAPKNP